MTDSNMKQVVMHSKLSRNNLIMKSILRKFVQREIINILDLPENEEYECIWFNERNFFGLEIIPKEKHVQFKFDEIRFQKSRNCGKKRIRYSVSYFQDYFNNKNETVVLDNKNLVELFLQWRKAN